MKHLQLALIITAAIVGAISIVYMFAQSDACKARDGVLVRPVMGVGLRCFDPKREIQLP